MRRKSILLLFCVIPVLLSACAKEAAAGRRAAARGAGRPSRSSATCRS